MLHLFQLAMFPFPNVFGEGEGGDQDGATAQPLKCCQDTPMSPLSALKELPPGQMTCQANLPGGYSMVPCCVSAKESSDDIAHIFAHFLFADKSQGETFHPNVTVSQEEKVCRKMRSYLRQSSGSFLEPGCSPKELIKARGGAIFLEGEGPEITLHVLAELSGIHVTVFTSSKEPWSTHWCQHLADLFLARVVGGRFVCAVENCGVGFPEPVGYLPSPPPIQEEPVVKDQRKKKVLSADDEKMLHEVLDKVQRGKGVWREPKVGTDVNITPPPPHVSCLKGHYTPVLYTHLTLPT